MKRFLQNIILLFGVLLLLNVLLDYGFSKYLSNAESVYNKDWKEITSGSLDADLLVMGTSRAQRHYDTRVLDSMLHINSYNLGQKASSIDRQMVKYKTYRHFQEKKPRFLIVNFDYFGWDRTWYKQEQYFPYFTNMYMHKLIRGLKQFSVGELYVPMYRYYMHGVKGLIKDARNKEFSYKGFHPNDKEWDGTAYASVTSVDFKYNQSNVDKFDVLLSELQNEGITVLFVSSPIYAGATEKTINLPEFYDFRNHFSEKYDIPVLDYTHDTLCSDTAYFYNAMHLNKTGAMLFTTKLCRDLDSLGLLK